MSRVVDFKPTRPPRPRCSWCHRQAFGSFIRSEAKTMHACRNHYRNGMLLLAKHFRTHSRGGGG